MNTKEMVERYKLRHEEIKLQRLMREWKHAEKMLSNYRDGYLKWYGKSVMALRELKIVLGGNEDEIKPLE